LAALQRSVEVSFQRASVYAYDHWRIVDPLQISAGLSYDRLAYPLNFSSSPVTSRRDTLDRWCPKAGIQWNPLKDTFLRAGYTRSLGGVAFDQSFRLEPVQVAGFNQAFRGLIPMAIEGTSSGECFETYGLAVETKLPSRTYLGLQLERLNSRADRLIGSSDLVGFPTVTTASAVAQKLSFREQSLILNLNQLVGQNWAMGTAYRLSQNQLFSQYPELTSFTRFRATQDNEALLHQINLYGMFNHRCGFFSRVDALWTQQANRGYLPDLPGDDFWQVNAYAGYRFWQRRAEVKLGVLNLTGQDYRLNPLNLTLELPRERTLMMSLKIAF
jgi:outer membrane receptor protein involved in Fe transport